MRNRGINMASCMDTDILLLLFKTQSVVLDSLRLNFVAHNRYSAELCIIMIVII